MNGKKVRAIGVLALVLLAIQAIPVDRRNPPVEQRIAASTEVRAILRRACFDCHSHETVWPWYSRIAPISWLIAHDVHEGRDKFNLSTWNRLRPRQESKARKEAWDEVSEGEMPPWRYLVLHPRARLSPEDKTFLRGWLLSGGL